MNLSYNVTSDIPVMGVTHTCIIYTFSISRAKYTIYVLFGTDFNKMFFIRIWCDSLTGVL